MTKIDIFSGFLGSGKTTLIKKLLTEAYEGEKIVLIENEFGEIGIDGGFLADAGIQINEMNSGCICCSLVGDFAAALTEVINQFAPDRILIEPSGVGKLSDVIKAVKGADTQGAILNGFTTVVDAKKCKMHMKNFGEFFNDQIENAACIVLSHTQFVSEEKINECIALIREHNADAVIVTTDWDKLSGYQLLDAMERTATLESEIERLKEQTHHHDDECCCHEHHHHEHEHHHEHDEECCCHEHHHEHGECCHHEHEHEHEHGECSCGHHHDHHHDHHHHHADEVFVSYGAETVKKFDADALKSALDEFTNTEKYGMVLRAKGIVESCDGRWIHFDYIPGEVDVRFGRADVIGRLCVIGSNLNKEAISSALNVEFN